MDSEALEVVALSASDAAANAEVEAFLDACPTSFAQQTIGWRNVITGIDGDEPCFLGCRMAGSLVGVLPAYRYQGPLGAILTSVPQAGPLGGVACHPDSEPESVYQALLSAFVDLALRSGCELATVITNPFWPDRDRCARSLQPDFVLENSCQVVDLESLGPDLAVENAPSGLRRNLRRARSGKLLIDEDQTPANVEAWYEIHAQRHTEIGALPLPRAFFLGALEQMVPRGKGRFFFVRQADDGEMVSGGLYLRHGAVVDAVMPSMRSDRARLSPNYLLAHHSMTWARAQGARFYNWQGSPPHGGVYRFKAQWGSRDAEYCFLTRITGNAAPFLEGTVEEITRGYPWHYVLPFDRVGRDGPGSDAASSRADAWKAREAAET